MPHTPGGGIYSHERTAIKYPLSFISFVEFYGGALIEFKVEISARSEPVGLRFDTLRCAFEFPLTVQQLVVRVRLTLFEVYKRN